MNKRTKSQTQTQRVACVPWKRCDRLYMQLKSQTSTSSTERRIRPNGNYSETEEVQQKLPPDSRGIFCTGSADRFYQPTSQSSTFLPCLPSPSCFRTPRCFSDRGHPSVLFLTSATHTRNVFRFQRNSASSLRRARGTEKKRRKYKKENWRRVPLQASYRRRSRASLPRHVLLRLSRSLLLRRFPTATLLIDTYRKQIKDTHENT